MRAKIERQDLSASRSATRRWRVIWYCCSAVIGIGCFFLFFFLGRPSGEFTAAETACRQILSSAGLGSDSPERVPPAEVPDSPARAAAPPSADTPVPDAFGGVVEGGTVSSSAGTSLLPRQVSGGSSSGASASAPASQLVFLEPVLPVPESGEVVEYEEELEPSIAPLEVKTMIGSNYFVKLSDATTEEPVLAMFIRGGQTEKIHVPLGTYELKYATGQRWYGYEHLFGPETQYAKANEIFTFTREGNRVSGYTITLYAVPGGNLESKRISPRDF